MLYDIILYEKVQQNCCLYEYVYVTYHLSQNMEVTNTSESNNTNIKYEKFTP
jgi:hypothetical protein